MSAKTVALQAVSFETVAFEAMSLQAVALQAMSASCVLHECFPSWRLAVTRYCELASNPELYQEGRYAGAMNEVTQKAQQEPDMS